MSPMGHVRREVDGRRGGAMEWKVGTPVTVDGLPGVVIEPDEAVMPAPAAAGYVRVRWSFDGYPAYSTSWERADKLAVRDA